MWRESGAGREVRRSTGALPVGRATQSAKSAQAGRGNLGWTKTVGNFRRTRYRGVERTSFAAYLVGAAYHLLRIAKLCPNR